jgi:hypothetical protein
MFSLKNTSKQEQMCDNNDILVTNNGSKSRLNGLLIIENNISDFGSKEFEDSFFSFETSTSQFT